MSNETTREKCRNPYCVKGQYPYSRNGLVCGYSICQTCRGTGYMPCGDPDCINGVINDIEGGMQVKCLKCFPPQAQTLDARLELLKKCRERMRNYTPEQRAALNKNLEASQFAPDKDETKVVVYDEIGLDQIIEELCDKACDEICGFKVSYQGDTFARRKAQWITNELAHAVRGHAAREEQGKAQEVITELRSHYEEQLSLAQARADKAEKDADMLAGALDILNHNGKDGWNLKQIIQRLDSALSHHVLLKKNKNAQ